MIECKWECSECGQTFADPAAGAKVGEAADGEYEWICHDCDAKLYPDG
ncbi:hypothetical protein LCGC14_2453710 [marine sediment metagenome]|uniref:Uncharacterized protein n=1 Tax=marine sediment metagenome TaxID=412755 RepID=A0A0F9E980_9ZZZZ